MTKDEFLLNLKNELDKYQIQDKDNILHEYENYFTLGYQANMTDDEIIKRYPSIEEIVKSYIHEVSVVKEYEYSRNDTKFAKGNFKNIYVDLISDNIEFSYEDNLDGIKVVFDNAKTDNYKVESTLDTFKLTYDAKNIVRKVSIFDLGKKANIKILVPINTYFELIYIKSISANIDLNYINSNELKIDTVSGNIRANRLQLQTINVSSVSGNFQVKYLSSNNVKFRFVSGKCSIEQGNIDNFSISGVSGHCEIKEGEVKNISTSCLSGKVIVAGKRV